jgi:hypothetical protein
MSINEICYRYHLTLGSWTLGGFQAMKSLASPPGTGERWELMYNKSTVLPKKYEKFRK